MLKALGCALTLAACGRAMAQEAERPAAEPPGALQPAEITGDRAFALALQLAVQSRDWQTALGLLDSRPDLANRTDFKRLKAELLKSVGRDREAIALLESHLTEAPDDAIARFQLAEIHFDDANDQAATLAYRLALSGALDPARSRLASARLTSIADRRKWRVWVGASIAPDSNLNAATDVTQVDLFGLPFDLDDAARRQSGVTLSAFAGIERRIRLNQTASIEADLTGSFTDAPGGQFDAAFAAVHAGPQWRFGRDSFFSLQAGYGRRWYGGDLLETYAGAQSELELAGDHTLWSGLMQVDAVEDHVSNARDGWLGSAEIARTRYLSPASLWRFGLSAVRREAEAKPEAFTQIQSALGFLTPGPLSTLIYVEPYVQFRDYDEAAAAFGVKRNDTETGVMVRASKRDWVVFGAFPFVSSTLAQHESTIDIFDFSRKRVEIGFTREF